MGAASRVGNSAARPAPRAARLSVRAAAGIKLPDGITKVGGGGGGGAPPPRGGIVAAAAAHACPRPTHPPTTPTTAQRQVTPKGDLVLARVAEAEETTTGGILLPTSAQRRPTSGDVVALGDGRVGTQDRPFTLTVGDTVLYSKFGIGATDLEVAGTPHILIREDDVIGVMPRTGATAEGEGARALALSSGSQRGGGGGRLRLGSVSWAGGEGRGGGFGSAA